MINLTGKMFIFKAKLYQIDVYIKCKNTVYLQYILETIIATNNNRITEHEKKWNICLS